MSQLKSFLKQCFPAPSGWRFATSGGVEVSVGPVGAVAGNLYVCQTRGPGTVYTLPFGGAGVGVSALPIGLSFSSKDAPGGGVGQIYTSPLASGPLGLKDFAGPCLIFDAGASAGPGASLALVFFNLDPRRQAMLSVLTPSALTPGGPLVAQALSARGVGLLWSGVASLPGASFTAYAGYVKSA
jgi:hypothetical protein